MRKPSIEEVRAHAEKSLDDIARIPQKPPENGTEKAPEGKEPIINWSGVINHMSKVITFACDNELETMLSVGHLLYLSLTGSYTPEGQPQAEEGKKAMNWAEIILYLRGMLEESCSKEQEAMIAIAHLIDINFTRVYNEHMNRAAMEVVMKSMAKAQKEGKIPPTISTGQGGNA